MLGNPLTILCVDRASGPDCDGDGVNDLVQVYEQPQTDASSNLVPDACPGG